MSVEGWPGSMERGCVWDMVARNAQHLGRHPSQKCLKGLFWCFTYCDDDDLFQGSLVPLLLSVLSGMSQTSTLRLSVPHLSLLESGQLTALFAV